MSTETAAPKFRVGDRVEWTNITGKTCTGAVTGVDLRTRVYVIDGDKGVSEFQLRPLAAGKD